VACVCVRASQCVVGRACSCVRTLAFSCSMMRFNWGVSTTRSPFTSRFMVTGCSLSRAPENQMCPFHGLNSAASCGDGCSGCSITLDVPSVGADIICAKYVWGLPAHSTHTGSALSPACTAADNAWHPRPPLRNGAWIGVVLRCALPAPAPLPTTNGKGG